MEEELLECQASGAGSCEKNPYPPGNEKTYPLHPGRLTWNLQITHLERKMIFQTSMIMFHKLFFEDDWKI